MQVDRVGEADHRQRRGRPLRARRRHRERRSCSARTSTRPTATVADLPETVDLRHVARRRATCSDGSRSHVDVDLDALDDIRLGRAASTVDAPASRRHRRRCHAGARTGLSASAAAHVAAHALHRRRHRPLGIGMLRAVGVDRLEPRQDVGHLSRLRPCGQLLTCRTSLASGTWPASWPTTISWIGVSLADPLVLAPLGGQQRPSRLGLPSPISTMPGGPTTRCTMSCCLVNAMAGLDLPAARSIPSARPRPRRACPRSGCTRPSGRGGRRRSARPRMPTSTPTDDRGQIRVPPEAAAAQREAQRARDQERRRAGTARSAGRTSWSSGSSARTA